MDSQPTDLASCAAARPRIEAFDMHPIDYALMQQAASLHELPETDFVQLAVYLCSRDVVALWGETKTRRTGNQTARNPHI